MSRKKQKLLAGIQDLCYNGYAKTHPYRFASFKIVFFVSFGNKFFSLRVINDSIIPGSHVPISILYNSIPLFFSAFVIYCF